jgi:hypothetical protein
MNSVSEKLYYCNQTRIPPVEQVESFISGFNLEIEATPLMWAYFDALVTPVPQNEPVRLRGKRGI